MTDSYVLYESGFQVLSELILWLDDMTKTSLSVKTRGGLHGNNFSTTSKIWDLLAHLTPNLCKKTQYVSIFCLTLEKKFIKYRTKLNISKVKKKQGWTIKPWFCLLELSLTDQWVHQNKALTIKLPCISSEAWSDFECDGIVYVRQTYIWI